MSQAPALMRTFGKWEQIPNPVVDGVSDRMARFKFVPDNPLARLIRRAGSMAKDEFKRQHPTLAKIGSLAYRGAKALGLIPSMASGGMIKAPKRAGKVVRLHNGEMVVPARQVPAVVRAARKSKIALPISAMRMRSKSK